MFFFLACTPGHKVPLNPLSRSLNIVGAHWFENEKVAYFFFRVSGETSYSGMSTFEWNKYSLDKSDSNSEFSALKLTQGIHQHQLLPCGRDICGSFSFASESAPAKITLRLRYHPKSALFVDSTAPVQVHQDDGTSNSFSSLVYGVFDESNNFIEARVHHNFGFPASSEVAQFGLIRSFRVHDTQLIDWSKADLELLKAQTHSATLFPVKNCEQWFDTSKIQKVDGVKNFSGVSGWLPNDFSVDPIRAGSCFKVDFLKANGETILTEQAIARRNPRLIEEKMVLSTPLKPVIKIPLVVTYCLNDPASDRLKSEIFLDYQKFILGITGAVVDACFRIGFENQFRDELKLVLLKKLQTARQNNVGLQDYIFTVAFNHKLNVEFQRFQEIVAEQIGLLIDDERVKISPRLIGAFVYDSDANFVRPELAAKSIVWCPRAAMPDVLSSVKAYGDGANCMADNGGLIKLGSILNFLVPMGPFPSRESYESYLNEYGDKGLARNPQFQVQSVITNANTVQDSLGLTTFFDGQRIDLTAEEGMRICYEKDIDGMLSSLRYKKINATTPMIENHEIQTVFNSTEGAGTYMLGLQWDYPFWGAVTYTSPLTGKILGQIPFRKDSTAHREVGDMKWQRENWDLGPYFQRCQRFCDHPYFDESGTYQLDLQWRGLNAIGCTHSKYPERQL
jgi:hypothetical protein